MSLKYDVRSQGFMTVTLYPERMSVWATVRVLEHVAALSLDVPRAMIWRLTNVARRADNFCPKVQQDRVARIIIIYT